MTKKEIRETLEKQLQLLSKCSEDAKGGDLAGLTSVMVTVSYRLEENLQVEDQ